MILDKKKSKKSCNKKNSTHKVNNTKDITSDPNHNGIVKDNTNGIGNNDNKNAKDHLGVIALIAIMELAIES